jgi:UDP-N-acetylglucosamine acyltransferase
MIHPTALVDPKAELGEGVEIGPFAVIEQGVTLGEGTKIGPHVIIREGTQIGKRCHIFQFCSVGEAPQAFAYKGEKTSLIVGDQNVIREYVTLHRGTLHGGGRTVIGCRNYFMAYSHVAHDCLIGDHVVLANGAALAGHIVIEDHAIIGALSGVHQFCRVGTHAFISGLTGVSLDIPPFMLAAGDRAKLFGLNSVGLKRAQFSEQTVRALKKAYRIFFRSSLPLEKAMKHVGEDVISQVPEVRHLLDFIRHTKRGITR